ncbi:MAG: YfiR family protein [Acidobacteriota bacterium]|nr:YfiR family protein [Acidobacteriota bacterium]
MTRKAIFLIFAFSLLGSPSVLADSAPASLQAALILKLLPFYTNLGNKEFKIHVIGAPDVAKNLKGMVGNMAGKAKLVEVTQSDGLPSGSVDVVYVGKDVAAGTQYSKENGVLSITGNPDLIEQGVTLGIGLENKKPKIYLNLKSSKAEGVDWNPAILKLAKTIQ